RNRTGDGVAHPQCAAVVEGAPAALQRAELPGCLSCIRAAASQARPRGAAAVLPLRVQRVGGLYRRDDPGAADSRRSPAPCVLNAAKVVGVTGVAARFSPAFAPPFTQRSSSFLT